jgi:hypothetical protein
LELHEREWEELLAETKTPSLVFSVVEAAPEDGYRYLCVNCGALLTDFATRKLMRSILICLECGTINEGVGKNGQEW